MARDDETFLRRWSRLKREEQQKPAVVETGKAAEPASQEEAAPALPPLESLTPESDFKLFMHPKVQDAVRRVALKKLFADPHFNVMDLNEAYSGDWTGGEPITPEMLKQLNQARTLLFPDEEKEKGKEKAAQPGATQQAAADPAGPSDPSTSEAEESKPDEPGRQDA